MKIKTKHSKVLKKKRWLYLVGMATALIVMIGVFSIKIAPFNMFGGVAWMDKGPRYISQEVVSSRVLTINKPKEEQMLQYITKKTKSCDSVNSGFCQKNTGVFVQKKMVSPAIKYVAGTPDRQEIIDYCTVCRDGTFSPSCAVGRGACSWHGGVSAYNVPRYRTIPGSPEIQAQPAQYTYLPKSYKDSPDYNTPPYPSLFDIVYFE